MSLTKSIPSARVICYINGKMLGSVMAFNWTSSTMDRPLETIDLVDPVELMTGRTNLAFNMSVLRTTLDGGSQGNGLTADFDNLTKLKYFSIALLDRGTDTEIFTAYQCMVVKESWKIDPKGTIVGTIEATGVKWNNEFRPNRTS